MSATIRCHGCGEDVPAWTRYHWTGPGTGHYTEPDPRAPKGEPDETGDDRPANIRRASAWWADGDVRRAPPPGDVPPKPWAKEEELRRSCNNLLRSLGYDVSDLEQGFRLDGSSRVELGLPDTYIQHPALGVRAWIEYKRWDNEPALDQCVFAEAELAAGGSWLLIYEAGQLMAWHALVRRAAT